MSVQIARKPIASLDWLKCAASCTSAKKKAVTTKELSKDTKLRVH